jgi:hypothetical protein
MKRLKIEEDIDGENEYVRGDMKDDISRNLNDPLSTVLPMTHEEDIEY